MDVYAELARNMVLEGQSLFITGKAGTGKTTLLKTITADLKRRGKNVVVIFSAVGCMKNSTAV